MFFQTEELAIQGAERIIGFHKRQLELEGLQ